MMHAAFTRRRFLEGGAGAGVLLAAELARGADGAEVPPLPSLPPARMLATKFLAIDGPNGTAAACDAEKVRSAFGSTLVPVPNERVMAYYREVPAAEAEAEAEGAWLSKALEVVEPTRPEVVDSARLYLAIRRLMADEGAHAVCSRACMGTPRGCLSFSMLNDLGSVGACEGDIDSTLTMLMFAYAFGVPGFISDPVIDTAKGAVVHFHCTSATRMDGTGGERLPFRIRTQTDSRGGVALEVTHRVGQPVTCAKLVNLDTLLFTPGTISEIGASPLACRTQFTQAVPDARRLFLEWGAGVVEGDTMTRLHRVVFYGDFRDRLEDLAAVMGLRLVEEGGPRATA
jgi:L-fucose isomerase-like protein